LGINSRWGRLAIVVWEGRKIHREISEIRERSEIHREIREIREIRENRPKGLEPL
jgi:hypothetical protein